MQPALPAAVNNQWQQLIAHIADSSKAVAAAESGELRAAESYCRLLPININGRSCSGLIDSGNVWRSVISLKFYLSLGLLVRDLRPVGIDEIHTAKEGADLKVMGEPRRTLHLRLQETATRYVFRPVVVKGLSMDVNLSGPWLKANRWDHIYSRDCLRIQGKDVPLRQPGEEVQVVSDLYLRNAVVAKANALTLVDLVAPAIKGGNMPCGDGIIRGSRHFMDKTDLHPGLNAIGTCDHDGNVRAAVLNTLDTDVTIRKGMSYGTFSLTCTPVEWDSAPQRICVMEAGAPAEPPSAGRRKRKQEDGDDDTMPAQPGANKKSTCTTAPPRESRADKKSTYLEKFVRTAREKERRSVENPKVDVTGFNEHQKRQWLQTEFNLKDSPFLRSAPDLAAATDVLLEFWDLFSHDGTFGKTSLIKHRIITPDDALPIKQRYRPINPSLEPDLRKQLDLWLDHGVIEPADSPWSSNLVAAKKKGGAIRWCIGTRTDTSRSP